MSKVKSSEIPHYELLYIISNKFSEDELAPIKDKVTNLITTSQGQITLQDDWGKKRLAYPIKHFRHGYYQLLEFDLPADKIKGLEDYLRLSDQILRHQIIRKDKTLVKSQTFTKSTPKIKEVTEPTQAEASKPIVETTIEPEVKETAPLISAIEEKPEVKSEPAPVEKTISTNEEKVETSKTEPAKKLSEKDLAMQDLDEKLDKILDSDTFL